MRLEPSGLCGTIVVDGYRVDATDGEVSIYIGRARSWMWVCTGRWRDRRIAAGAGWTLPDGALAMLDAAIVAALDEVRP